MVLERVGLSITRLTPIVLGSLLCLPAYADAPSFDRPGLGFAPAVLPAGSFAWEQGLPDFQSDTTSGVRTRFYAADTNLRLGLDGAFELQLGGSLWNRLDVRDTGVNSHHEGAGDTKVSMKWAPTLATKAVTLAVLGGVTLDTGSAAFTNGRRVYSLGVDVSHDLGSGRSIAAYTNVDHSGGSNVWTVSGNYSFPINASFGGYVEGGRVFGGGASSTLAGGGVTWVLHDRVQFDLFGRRGLSSHSPDLQGGFGISVFWK
jgi:hypothetical protein